MKKLSLQDYGSIAEVIGALAIVVSLIYVGVQVSDSAAAVRSATANDTSAAMSQWYVAVGSAGFLKYWSQRREIFQPSFRGFVDDLVAQGTTNKNLEQLYQPKGSE